jgi:hypothetical protein
LVEWSRQISIMDSIIILSPAFGHRSDLQLSVVVSVVDGGVPGRSRPVGTERFGKCSPQATVLDLELTDVLVSGNEPGPERWIRGALPLGDNRARRGTLPSSEPVDLSTQVGLGVEPMSPQPERGLRPAERVTVETKTHSTAHTANRATSTLGRPLDLLSPCVLESSR